MGDAEAKLRIKAEGAGEASQQVGALADNMGRVAGAAPAATSRLGALGASLGSLRGALAAGGVFMFARFVTSSIQAASAAEDATNAFGRMAQARGIGNFRQTLTDMNNAFDGMVPSAQVAMIATRLLATNSAMTGDRLIQAAKFARSFSDATGQELAPTIEMVSDAMRNMSSRGLKQLGIEVDLEAAVKKSARALGVKADALIETQRRAIEADAVFSALAAKQKELGDASLDAGDNLSRAEASFADVKVVAGQGFGEIFGPALAAIADIAKGKPIGASLAAASGEYTVKGMELAQGVGAVAGLPEGMMQAGELQLRDLQSKVDLYKALNGVGGPPPRTIKTGKVVARSAGGG